MGPAFFPLDERLKLASYQQTTRRLERLICEVGLRLPYEQAADVLNDLLGITIAGRQVERIVDRHGQRAIAVREAIRRGLGIAAPAEAGIDLEAIRQIIADELSKSLTALHLQPTSYQNNTPAQDIEAAYGSRLDRMLGGLTKAAISDSDNQ